jgi:hypothetical protein
VWLVGFIVAAALFAIALVFGIFMFLGKNSESDKKDKAQKELASTKGQLGTSQESTRFLLDLASLGDTAGTDLLACARSDVDLENTFRDAQSTLLDAFNQAQNGADVNPLVPGINAKLDTVRSKTAANDSLCSKAADSLKAFNDALAPLKRANQ